jgi:hypothetical protein
MNLPTSPAASPTSIVMSGASMRDSAERAAAEVAAIEVVATADTGVAREGNQLNLIRCPAVLAGFLFGSPWTKSNEPVIPF